MEEVDCDPQRRRARVHHHSVLLGEQLGGPPFELGGGLADIEGRIVPHHVDDRFDLAFVAVGTSWRQFHGGDPNTKKLRPIVPNYEESDSID